MSLSASPSASDAEVREVNNDHSGVRKVSDINVRAREVSDILHRVGRSVISSTGWGGH